MSIFIQLVTLLAVTYTALALCHGAPTPSTPVVERPPLGHHVSFFSLRNVRNLDHSDISELYIKVLEEKQSLDVLLNSMVRYYSYTLIIDVAYSIVYIYSGTPLKRHT